MNEFTVSAVVAGDMEYTEPYEANNELPIAFSHGGVTTKACILAAFDASMPPDGGIEEGQRVIITGELREADGEIFPVATEVILEGEYE